MPHMFLEYSSNVPDPVDDAALLSALHEAVAALPTFSLADIKSRITRVERYRVADGHPEGAFVHLELAVMDGRDAALRQRAAGACLEVLQRHFPRALQERRCQLTVEVREMVRATYAKVRSPPAP